MPASGEPGAALPLFDTKCPATCCASAAARFALATAGGDINTCAKGGCLPR
jgi:hypothetical protein